MEEMEEMDDLMLLMKGRKVKKCEGDDKRF